MGITEIVLLLAGGIVFILSFVIPAKREEDYEETRGLAKEEIRNLVSEELESVRGHVDDVVEEAVTYSIEKTERSLERLSNEKIMAVNEYSDTVLSEIHKNHEEVMFLYDMLNDKHVNLKNTVSEVNKTVKEVAETKREAEEVVNTFQRLAPEAVAAAMTENREVNSQPAPQVSAFVQHANAGQIVQPVNAGQIVQPVELQQFMRAVQPTKAQSAVQKATKLPETAPTVPLELIQPQISAFVRSAKTGQTEQPAESQQYVSPIQFEQPAESQQYVPPIQFEQPTESQQYVPPIQFEQPTESQQYVPPIQFEQPTESQQYVPPMQFEQPTGLQQFVPPAQASETVHALSESTVFRGATLPTGAISFTQETDEQGRNYNDVILELYKKGKSKVAIAKELNLGVGEVNLVIDLYKNM